MLFDQTIIEELVSSVQKLTANAEVLMRKLNILIDENKNMRKEIVEFKAEKTAINADKHTCADVAKK